MWSDLNPDLRTARWGKVLLPAEKLHLSSLIRSTSLRQREAGINKDKNIFLTKKSHWLPRHKFLLPGATVFVKRQYQMTIKEFLCMGCCKLTFQDIFNEHQTGNWQHF